VIYYNVRGIKEISYIDMLSDVEELSENGAPGGSDSSRVSPPKILGSKATENFYLLPFHSSLFTENAPENFEVRSNSEEVRSENYNGSDLSPNAPPTKKSNLSIRQIGLF